MERLTEKGHVYHSLEFMEDGISCFVNKLREYEDLEEQGLLLRLPCKVGDTVYNITPRALRENKYNIDIVSKIVISNDSILICFENGLAKKIESVGNSLLLTKGELEQKLAEMKEK